MYIWKYDHLQSCKYMYITLEESMYIYHNEIVLYFISWSGVLKDYVLMTALQWLMANGVIGLIMDPAQELVAEEFSFKQGNVIIQGEMIE